jgi:hypothetical protein
MCVRACVCVCVCAILLDESHKLDPWPLDEGPRPKELMIEGQRYKLGSKMGSISRIQFASNESKLVPRNLDPTPI